jgi:DNA-binding LytR/AlgR family response regulator
VDDEKPALDELNYLLSQQSCVASVDTADDATSALRCLHEHTYDAVFLDIRMPGLDGMELARLLRRFAEPPAVVFVTAFDSYAIEAFEVRAHDYLLKPLSSDRLAEALAKVAGDVPPAVDGDDMAVLPVETGGLTRLVDRDDVCWVEANGDYVRLHTVDGAGHLVRVPLSVLAERWAAAGFARIHRSHLVALRHVTQLRTEPGGLVARVAGHDLPVSRRHTRDFKERLLHAARRSANGGR